VCHRHYTKKAISCKHNCIANLSYILHLHTLVHMPNICIYSCLCPWIHYRSDLVWNTLVALASAHLVLIDPRVQHLLLLVLVLEQVSLLYSNRNHQLHDPWIWAFYQFRNSFSQDRIQLRCNQINQYISFSILLGQILCLDMLILPMFLHLLWWLDHFCSLLLICPRWFHYQRAYRHCFYQSFHNTFANL